MDEEVHGFASSTGAGDILPAIKPKQKKSGQKLMQVRADPHSYLGPGPDHVGAWNDAQYDAMNPGTWEAETTDPKGYQHWLENNKATQKRGQKLVQKAG